MKKQYLDFTKVHYYQTGRRFAPKIGPRNACYRSGGDDDDDDEGDGDDEKREKFLKKIEARVKKQLAGRATVEQIAEINKSLVFLTKGKNEKGEDVDAPFPIDTLREMADPKSGVMQKLVDMGVQIQEMKAAGERAIKDMSIRGQVEAWQTKHKETIAKIAAGEKVTPPPMELDLRAAGTMHVSTVNAESSPYIGRVEVEPGINPILRFDNTFWDYIRKGRASAPTLVWVNMVNPDGEAAFIGPGVLKPGIDFELDAETSIAKKIADSAKAGTEILQDIVGMTDMIETELKAKIYIKANETLMANSAGSSTVPAGIRYYAQDVDGSAFTAAFDALKTTNPNYYDVIRSAVAALRSGKLKGKITVFINPIDAGNMDMAKASDSGVYTIPPFSTADGRKIGGATVVEDQNIAVGSLLAVFLDYYVIKIYKDLIVQWGWENDDFTRNLVTAIAEMRLHQYVNSIHTGFAFYDSFEDVKTRITEA